ncbi:helix-turn-helix transcriptional regulator [Gemella sp. GH3]|uniref:helix-turn-helix domain-containing protein n=1 Tax=unclassified Gemella TaxID=2624949 RepID=UPI0015D09A35|nr:MULTISPECIES: helix-turn-helix transcriptional regulator [unclassified Gemella]MBF0714527.1 helix-turn-helix transcriptional regulator [Gemella sp. GH3.1]NYS51479.1 helix-turn-helix transcriptional regulator [Gemella sp. GH3]
MKKFNELMLKRRKELGMTRYKLHKLTGLSQQMLFKIESNIDNTLKLENAVKIAKVLDIDLNIFKSVI